MIKAIDTYYNGNYYRSRLEARWSIVLAMFDGELEYEPEGFVVNGSPYLPDFKIIMRNGEMWWVEVKPLYCHFRKQDIIDSCVKCIQLAIETKSNALICMGNPKSGFFQFNEQFFIDMIECYELRKDWFLRSETGLRAYLEDVFEAFSMGYVLNDGCYLRADGDLKKIFDKANKVRF